MHVFQGALCRTCSPTQMININVLVHEVPLKNVLIELLEPFNPEKLQSIRSS